MLLYYRTWLLNETEEQTKSSQHGAEVTAGLVSLFFYVLLSKMWENLNKVKIKLMKKKKEQIVYNLSITRFELFF